MRGLGSGQNSELSLEYVGFELPLGGSHGTASERVGTVSPKSSPESRVEPELTQSRASAHDNCPAQLA